MFKKLECIGVRDSDLMWFKSYLNDTSQVKCLNNELSDLRKVEYVVVQGTTMGTLLSEVYINNIVGLI